MICDNCKIDRLVNDFIKNQKFCYRCVYRIKLKKIVEKRKAKTNFCRHCGGKVIAEQNVKKRQRTVFCSVQCAQKGHKNQLSNYWTRKISRENLIKEKKKNG